MTNLTALPVITYQSVVVDTCGTIAKCFELQEVVVEAETNFVVTHEKNGANSVTVIHKDPMFNDSVYDYNLGEFVPLMTASGGLFFVCRRYVLGDATDAQSQAECFAAINKIMGMPYNEILTDGCYLNSTGQLCKKDESGRELFIDYTTVKATATETAGYVQTYPERDNNCPIPSHQLPMAIKPVVITPPKMTVDEWLDIPMMDLLDDEGKALALERAAEREQRHINNGIRFREKLDKQILSQARYEAWTKEKQEQSVVEAKYGIQLSLI